MSPITVSNWFGSVVSSPVAVVEARSVEEIVAVLKDPQHYPAPVRAVGSNHSTTPCGAADGGTVIVMRNMDRIIEIRDDEVTVEAGALYIDVGAELRQRNLQFYVNVELGNLTIGSASCGGTKDASMPGEFGQIASYAKRIKMVTPAGELVEITEDDPELMQVARSSYGLFGIIYEVTFRIRPLRPLAVHHEKFSFDEFSQQLPALKARGTSLMLYINPFTDTINVEFREYHEDQQPVGLTDWQWRLRNWVWSKAAPRFCHLVTTYVPGRQLRELLINNWNRFIVRVAILAVRGDRTAANAQTIRYPSISDSSRYTFSIWAFPEEQYLDCLRAYFEFSRNYYRTTGYRVDIESVGYRINSDQSSLFSYSFAGNVMTFDPVSTGNPGWTDFLSAYNELCSGLGGIPLFNQTSELTRPQVQKAFGDRLAKFETYRKRFDPTDRLLNDFFRELIADPAAQSTPAGAR